MLKSFLPGRGEEKSFLIFWSASAGGGTWFRLEFWRRRKSGGWKGVAGKAGRKGESLVSLKTCSYGLYLYFRTEVENLLLFLINYV